LFRFSNRIAPAEYARDKINKLLKSLVSNKANPSPTQTLAHIKQNSLPNLMRSNILNGPVSFTRKLVIRQTAKIISTGFKRE
jgi:hypothetical protein